MKNKGINFYNKSAGFTLIELLATIVILGIVITIVISFSINIVSYTKSKSYQVVIKNIESGASNYVIEDIGSNRWVQNDLDYDSQYQCVSVQDLIDAGYFNGDILKSKISEEELVSFDDMVYLERNKESKTIVKNVFLVGNREEYLSLCNNVYTIGDIFFEYPSGWSKSKEIVITYKLYNLDKQVSEYKYNYVYFLSDGLIKDRIVDTSFNTTEVREKLTVNKNGTVNAKIVDLDINKSLVIDSIDNEKPDALIISENKITDSQKVVLEMDDNGGSGLKQYYFGLDNPYDNDVEWKDVSIVDSLKINTVVDKSGVWYLGVKDLVGNINVVSVKFNTINLNISNAIVEPNKIVVEKDTVVSLPKPSLNSFAYEFIGWYESSNFVGSSVSTYKVTNDKTFYGKVIHKQYTVTYYDNGCGLAPEKQVNNVLDKEIIKDMQEVTIGKKFNGWNTKSDGSGINYNNGDIYSLDKDLSLYAICSVNNVFIRYNANGGKVMSSTKDSNGTYTWTTDSFDTIFRSINGGAKYADLHILNYNEVLGVDGLLNMNNPYYLNISKTGYSVTNDYEWVCLDGCDTNDKTFSQSKQYNSNDFCDASSNSCTVTLGVNWSDKNGPIITFDKDGSSGKWIKTANVKISVTDSGSGVDVNSLKFVFSESSSVSISNKTVINYENNSKLNEYYGFVNGDIVSLSDLDGKYYLIAYACDNSNNCTTKVSNVYKLDNTPPTISCRDGNEVEIIHYKLDSNYDPVYDSNGNRLVAHKQLVKIEKKNNQCQGYHQLLLQKTSAHDPTCSDAFEYSDNNSEGVKASCGFNVYYDDDGNTSCTKTLASGKKENCIKMATACNCIHDDIGKYCTHEQTYTVTDQAGNTTKEKFILYIRYEDPDISNSVYRKNYCDSNRQPSSDGIVESK